MANDSIAVMQAELTASIESSEHVSRPWTVKSAKNVKNERLERLGNESNSALITKIDELNQITNKSQLDGERLRAMER